MRQGEQAEMGEQTGKRSVARQPQRRPGQLRFKILLDALEVLLAENGLGDVGLTQIAEKAGVPPASVYHFFPNKEAALLALATVHHQALLAMSGERLAVPPASWQDMLRQKVTGAARYHNEHPAALRLFFGANISAEVKTADTSQYFHLAEKRAALLEHYFHMPLIPDWDRRLATYFSVIDGVFSLAYSRHGLITDQYVAEAHQAGIAYLRCYLPEILTPRG